MLLRKPLIIILHPAKKAIKILYIKNFGHLKYPSVGLITTDSVSF